MQRITLSVPVHRYLSKFRESRSISFLRFEAKHMPQFCAIRTSNKHVNVRRKLSEFARFHVIRTSIPFFVNGTWFATGQLEME